MSIDYGLVCIDCGEALNLGKTHSVETPFHTEEFCLEKSFGFAAIGNVSDDFRQNQVQFLAALQHFLIMHRQHELRVLPDNRAAVQSAWCWYEYLDISEGGLLHLLSQPVTPPWPDSEAKQLDPALLGRLQENAQRAEDRLMLDE